MFFLLQMKLQNHARNALFSCTWVGIGIFLFKKKKKKYVITRMRLNDVSLNNPLE